MQMQRLVMAKTSKANNESAERKGTERKPDFLPLIAETFVERGYRRTTTAQLAKCCGVRENELYRIWPNKKLMFLDSIQYVFDNSVQAWSEGIQPGSKLTAAEQLIARQSTQRGTAACIESFSPDSAKLTTRKFETLSKHSTSNSIMSSSITFPAIVGNVESTLR